MTPILLAQILVGIFVTLGAAVLLVGRLKGKHSALQWTLAGMMAAVGLTLFFGPCIVGPKPLDGPRVVVFESHLSEELQVYVDGEYYVTLAPFATTGVTVLVRGANVIQKLEVRAGSGRIVYRQDISGRILDTQAWRIVIDGGVAARPRPSDGLPLPHGQFVAPAYPTASRGRAR